MGRGLRSTRLAERYGSPRMMSVCAQKLGSLASGSEVKTVSAQRSKPFIATLIMPDHLSRSDRSRQRAVWSSRSQRRRAGLLWRTMAMSLSRSYRRRANPQHKTMKVGVSDLWADARISVLWGLEADRLRSDTDDLARRFGQGS